MRYERQLAADFRKRLKKAYPDLYIYTDRDTGKERPESGWDFFVQLGMAAIEIEAKRDPKKRWQEIDNPLLYLTPGQKMHYDHVMRTGGMYAILMFTMENGRPLPSLFPYCANNLISGTPIVGYLDSIRWLYTTLRDYGRNTKKDFQISVSRKRSYSSPGT